MVIAGKVFVLAEPVGLAELKEALSALRFEEEREEDGQVFKLVREVRDLAEREGTLLGIYAEDFLTRVFHRGETRLIPRTSAAPSSAAIVLWSCPVAIRISMPTKVKVAIQNPAVS